MSDPPTFFCRLDIALDYNNFITRHFRPAGAKKILDFYPKISNYYVNNIGLVGAGYWCSSLDMVLNAFYDSNNAFISIPPLSYVVNDKTASAIWYTPEREEIP